MPAGQNRKETTFIRVLVHVGNCRVDTVMETGPAIATVIRPHEMQLMARLSKRQWLAHWYVVLLTQAALNEVRKGDAMSMAPLQVVVLGQTGGACGRRCLPLPRDCSKSPSLELLDGGKAS